MGLERSEKAPGVEFSGRPLPLLHPRTCPASDRGKFPNRPRHRSRASLSPPRPGLAIRELPGRSRQKERSRSAVVSARRAWGSRAWRVRPHAGGGGKRGGIGLDQRAGSGALVSPPLNLFSTASQAAFMHLRFLVEEGRPVTYVYEIQVASEFQVRCTSCGRGASSGARRAVSGRRRRRRLGELPLRLRRRVRQLSADVDGARDDALPCEKGAAGRRRGPAVAVGPPLPSARSKRFRNATLRAGSGDRRASDEDCGWDRLWIWAV